MISSIINCKLKAKTTKSRNLFIDTFVFHNPLMVRIILGEGPGVILQGKCHLQAVFRSL